MWFKLLKKIVKFLDPKLEKYRDKKKPEPKYAPKTVEEFVDLIKRTPKSVLSLKERERIAAVMSFDGRRVADLMTPRESMIFVESKEILGPLTLDKLYKSGFTSFPVLDAKGKIKGVLNTEALNALEIKKTDKAEKYLDDKVKYLNCDDSLKEAIDEIKRTNSCYFLVLNEKGEVSGFFTVQMLIDYLGL